MRAIGAFALLLPLVCSAQNFQFTARGHTYTVTMTSEATAGLSFAGHSLYEISPIWPSSLTNNQYVLIYTSNPNAYPSGWPIAEGIFVQTSTNGLNWGAPTEVLSKASNICDMADARPIYDIASSVWRVFVQAVTYSGSTCSPDAQLFEAVGSSLTSLSWYGSGGSATSLSGDLGDPGLGEAMQWFNTANYNGPSSTPIFYVYNDWNFTGVNSSYCPTCTNNGTPMFAYLTANAETGFNFWYYTSPSYNSIPGLLYPDVLLGGTDDQATLGPPGFSFGPQGISSACSGSNPGTQYGSGIGFYPTPVPNNDGSPSLPGQFESGTFSSSDSGLITYVRAARNPYGFLDKASSNPNTWYTFLYYNIADESNGTACPEPTIQNTWLNHGGSGNPSSALGATYVTITEQ
jgi:hypothetical protein